MQLVLEAPEHEADFNYEDTACVETAKGDGSMTTLNSSRHHKSDKATAAKQAKQTTVSSKATSPTEVNKKKRTTPKMPREQMQNNSTKSRKMASNLLGANGSTGTLSKRNRRRKKQFNDPDQFESEMRQAYFSAASWVAIRYSVSIEDLIDHLRAGGIHFAPRPNTALQYVEDIVLCVAICKGSKQAWNDLRHVFDLTLNRACTLTLSEQDAVVYVQKFLSELAEATEHGADATAHTTEDEATEMSDPTQDDTGLRGYIGLLPLRVWLTNKILADLEEMPLPQSTSATDNGGAPRPALQLVH
jgi:hypothetical protein